MMSPRELFFQLLKPEGRPDRQLVQYEALAMLLPDPVNTYLRGNRVRGSLSRDRWGTLISFPEDAPGPMPLSEGEDKVCKDILHWRDYVKAPDLVSNCVQGWEDCARRAREAEKAGYVSAAFMGTGIFEQCHFLMGFEDTLTNLYEHPEEMRQLIDYITEYRLTYVKLLIDKLQPEAIFSHDDWGAKEALFMSPEMWRDFFKEPYRRFYGYIRSRGVIAIHHADSYLVPIVEDMAEIGIQVWQGVLPENDIPALQRRLQGRMCLMGGIGAAIDRADSGEEEIRAYVRGVLESCCPGGHFIPSISYGLAGCVYPHVDKFINSEIEAYNRELHMPVYSLPPLPERRAPKPEAAPQKAPADTGHGGLKAISEALKRGQKNKLLSLCREALQQGLSAEEIVSGGLVPGMSLLGEDFSAGKAFVPEMLMAARCMNAAMELLKPMLAGRADAAVGRVCLGTVRGDMHDIGKNLVKIMMEGAGLQVIDLGVDVPAESFVDTALRENCPLIACSSLLTTTMDEMRRVVELAESRGVRDKIKIMIGGAPISQAFCDEIGADAYTDDAAQAAKTALSLLGARA